MAKITNAWKSGLCIKTGIQERRTECGERGEWEECYIAGNVAKHSGEHSSNILHALSS